MTDTDARQLAQQLFARVPDAMLRRLTQLPRPAFLAFCLEMNSLLEDSATEQAQ